MNEVLRFTLGRTYGVSVQDSFFSAPPMFAPDQPLPGTIVVRVLTSISVAVDTSNVHAVVVLGWCLGVLLGTAAAAVVVDIGVAVSLLVVRWRLVLWSERVRNYRNR